MKPQTFPATKSCLRISKASNRLLKSYCLSKSELYKTSNNIKLSAKPRNDELPTPDKVELDSRRRKKHFSRCRLNYGVPFVKAPFCAYLVKFCAYLLNMHAYLVFLCIFN